MSAGADRFEADAERSGTPGRTAPPTFPGSGAATERIAVGQTRGRRTRRTVDLTPAQHRALDIWQRDAADRLGLARVTGQEVLTALIDQLLMDRELSARIQRAIQSGRR
ncbi:hypothetical protein MFM001_33920 [Mycobacterium sp. MFM001]|uniref:hypothetical protein n=1 Tax=Mycobacterium sp. MFM001 TaxID=2049453 RepID=UPI000DA54A34|nr:hypothetical protein [Mycobacterium sp. MFM001]GBE66930.1 hypothetical protein MFM001_33920 [Mycobacterium sp. MFM001]